MGVSGQRHAPAALYPLYPLYIRLGGPESREDVGAEKSFASAGIELRSSSQYRHCTSELPRLFARD
jgi:hypothetical protein